MNITNVAPKELYEIVTGKNYDSTHISVDEALKKYPNVNMKAVRTVDSFEKTSESGIDTSSIAGIYKREFSWGKAGVTGYSIDELADEIGNIGKRLDKAFGEGKFSAEEYEELNKSLDEYAEKLTARSERTTATLAAIRENKKPGLTMSPEEYQMQLNMDITAYLTNKNSRYYCGIDRNLLNSMISLIRNGR